MKNRYTIRTIAAGILFYVLLEILFPNLNFFLQILGAFVFFFGILFFFPKIRNFFIPENPQDKSSRKN